MGATNENVIEQLDSAGSPLAFYRLFVDCRRQLHSKDAWGTRSLDYLFAIASACFTHVHRSVLVRAPVYRQVARVTRSLIP